MTRDRLVTVYCVAMSTIIVAYAIVAAVLFANGAME